MRLVVKQSDNVVNEFQFSKGPIYIGRHTDSQIFLPNRKVSRQHAVIFSTQDGKWMVEDLNSTNKTYLNDEAIQKTEIKTGDILNITDITIEINLEDDTIADKPINLEDTLTKTVYGLESTGMAMTMEPLPPKRAKDFVQATEAICKANGLDEILQALLSITARQFTAYHTWCALRDQTAGSMTCHAGKQRDGSAVELSDIQLNEKINEAVDKGQFLLLPRIPPQRHKKEKDGIHSAMIAPIVGQAGCFGVLYIDNDMAHEHYNLSDLDYLMLLAIHTASILKNF